MDYNCTSDYCNNLFNQMMKKINLSITGCMGRMGQQLIKSANKNSIVSEQRLRVGKYGYH